MLKFYLSAVSYFSPSSDDIWFTNGGSFHQQHRCGEKLGIWQLFFSYDSYVSNPKEKIDDFAILFRDVKCLYILYICALCVCVCRARDPYVYII